MTRPELHKLVDELPENAIAAAARALERGVHDPMLLILDAASFDDEPYTDEERVEDARARSVHRTRSQTQESRRGRSPSNELGSGIRPRIDPNR